MTKKRWMVLLAAMFVLTSGMSAYADSDGPGGPGSGIDYSAGETTYIISGGLTYISGDSSGSVQSVGAPGSSSQTAGLPNVESYDVSGTKSNVSVDPIMGYEPFLHLQMLTTAGELTEGFTTNMGAFNSPGDGFAGLKIRSEQSIGDIYYRVYLENHGWTKWAMNEMITPYTYDGSRVTAVQIRGNGHTFNLYDIYYRAVLNDGTVTDWGHDGQSVGTIGTGLYIQRLQVAYRAVGTEFDQPVTRRLISDYDEGVCFGADGIAYYQTYNNQPYTGWGYDTDNNKYYFVDSHIVTGWQYIDGYKYYFDSNGIVVTDLEPIIGIQSDYMIRLNKDMKTLTVYTQDGDNGYILPVKVILTTIGEDTPLGTFKTYEAYRWKYMHDDIYCQYLLRFKSGYLLHSIIYYPQPSSYALTASTYNYLGKNQSDGCVRMLSGDAWWVYTYCGVGTTVVIYSDEWSTGPFDRPAIQQGIPFDQNYDPTDPVIVAEQAAQAQAEAAAAAAQALE